MNAKTLAPLVALVVLAGCVTAGPLAAPPSNPASSAASSAAPSPASSVATATIAPRPSVAPKPSPVAKAIATPTPQARPKATPKPVAIVATPTPDETSEATETPSPLLKVTTSCTSIVVDAGGPAWVMIYAAPLGVVTPTAEQERIIDADAPTGMQSLDLPADAGPYSWDVSVTYWDTVEARTGTTDCAS